MKHLPLALLFALLPGFAVAGTTPAAASSAPVYVQLTTTDGEIFLRLDVARAPKTVANFVQYVRDRHYDGTVFHRVIPGFVAQGGGYTPDFQEKPARAPVENESRNGLSNRRGTIAMARTNDPHSAAAQWYINLADNGHLDGTKAQWGYTVFGEVARGMEVLDEIARIPTGPAGPFGSDVPFRPVIVKQAVVIDKLPELDAPAPAREEAGR